MAFGDMIQEDSDSALASSITLTLGSSPTVDNLLIINAFTRDTTIDTPTGFTLAVQNDNSTDNDTAAIFYRIVQSGDGTSYSVVDNSGGQYIAAHIREYEGPWATSVLGETATSTVDTGSQTSHQSASTGTLSQADNIIAALCAVRQAGSTPITSPSVDQSFSLNHVQSTGPNRAHLLSSFLLVSATTAKDPTWSWTSNGDGAWACIAAFKKEATGGASDVLNRGLSGVEFGETASTGGGHSGLHPIERGYVS